VPIILWGFDAPSDVLRRRMRCTVCGRRGAGLRLPSSSGTNEAATFPAVY
jgi:hypothetical protein